MSQVFTVVGKVETERTFDVEERNWGTQLNNRNYQIVRMNHKYSSTLYTELCSALRGWRVNEGHSPCTQGVDMPFGCLRHANVREITGKSHKCHDALQIDVVQSIVKTEERCELTCLGKSCRAKHFWNRKAFEQATQTHQACIGERELAIREAGRESVCPEHTMLVSSAKDERGHTKHVTEGPGSDQDWSGIWENRKKTFYRFRSSFSLTLEWAEEN